MKKSTTYVQKIFYVYLIVLIPFVIGNYMIGGEALSGKIENHKYFVKGAKTDKEGNKIFTEVSKATYTYSKIHIWILFIATATLAIAVIKEKLISKRKTIQS